MELISVAVEDARTRHAAVWDLIKGIDQQAMALLSFYSTIAVASVSGAGAILGTASFLPDSVGYGLAAASACFVAGSACCFRVLATATINLPGREAAFWQWAVGHKGLTELQVLQSYLDGVASREEMNNRVCARGSRWLGRARMFGIIAPIAAGIAILFTWRPA